MTWSLTPPRRVGTNVFVAVARTEVSAECFGKVLTVAGTKRPLIILQFSADTVAAMDLSGQPIRAEEVEKSFPGAISDARHLLGDVT